MSSDQKDEGQAAERVSNKDRYRGRASRQVIATNYNAAKYNDKLRSPAEGGHEAPNSARITGKDALVLAAGGADDEELARGSERLRDLAADGQLKVWGRRGQRTADLHQEIPLGFFMGKSPSVRFTVGNTIENERCDVLWFDVEVSKRELRAALRAQREGAATRGAQLTAAGERSLLRHLVTLMREAPGEPQSKREVKAQLAKAKVPFSERAFDRAWPEAARVAGAPAWSAAGRRRKSPR